MTAITRDDAGDLCIVVGAIPPRSRHGHRGYGRAGIRGDVCCRDDFIVSSPRAEIRRRIGRVVCRGITDGGGTTRGVEYERPRLRIPGPGIEHPAIEVDGSRFHAASRNAAIGRRHERLEVERAADDWRENGRPLQRSAGRTHVGAFLVVANVARALDTRRAIGAAVGLAIALSVANATAHRGRIGIAIALWRECARSDRAGDIAGRASSRARRIAANAIDAMPGRTLGIAITAVARIDHRAGFVAIADACAPAFVVRIVSGDDRTALSVVATAAFGYGASHAASRTGIAAADFVDAIPGDAFGCRGACYAIEVAAGAEAIAIPAQAFVIGIFLVRDGAARAVISLAFFRGRTSIAGVRARRIATYAVDAMARRALRIRRALCTDVRR